MRDSIKNTSLFGSHLLGMQSNQGALTLFRHSRESGNLYAVRHRPVGKLKAPWILAFAGMTETIL